jgi:hypothetical protein
MFLALENGHLLNTDSVTSVEFVERGTHEGKAIAWGYGIVLAGGESRVVYDHYKPFQVAAIAAQNAPKPEAGA